MSAPVRHADGVVYVDVQVVPRASRDRIGPRVGDRIKIQLCAPPVDGAANEALVALLARVFDVPRRQISLVAGERGRKKTVRIVGGEPQRLAALLESEAGPKAKSNAKEDTQ